MPLTAVAVTAGIPKVVFQPQGEIHMTLKWRLGTEENHLTPFGCVCALLVGILIYLVLVLPNDAVPHSQSDIRSQQQSGQP